MSTLVAGEQSPSEQKVWGLRGRLRSSPVEKTLICSANSWCWQSWRWETIVQSCSFHYGPVKITDGMSSLRLANCLPRDRRWAATTQSGGVDSLEAKGHQFGSQHEHEAPKGQAFKNVTGGSDNPRYSWRIGTLSSPKSERILDDEQLSPINHDKENKTKTMNTKINSVILKIPPLL